MHVCTVVTILQIHFDFLVPFSNNLNGYNVLLQAAKPTQCKMLSAASQVQEACVCEETTYCHTNPSLTVSNVAAAFHEQLQVRHRGRSES